MQKILYAIAMVFVTAVVVGWGVFSWQNQTAKYLRQQLVDARNQATNFRNEKENLELQVEWLKSTREKALSDARRVLEKARTEPVREWAVYTNPIDGYQLKYPKGWIIDGGAQEKGIVFFGRPERLKLIEYGEERGVAYEIEVRVYRSSSELPGNGTLKLPFQLWLTQVAPREEYVSAGSITVGGVSGYQFKAGMSQVSGFGLPSRILVEYNAKIYELSFYDLLVDDLPRPDAQEIIRSFQFL